MRALVYWLAAHEAEVHYIDAILSAYDGLANVRRDFILKDAKAYYKVFVADGMEDEFLEIAERLRAEGAVEDFFREEPGAGEAASAGTTEGGDGTASPA